MFTATRLSIPSLSRIRPDDLAPGDMALLGAEHTPSIRCVAPGGPELWLLDVQRGFLQDLHRSAQRNTRHLAVAGVRWHVQLGPPVAGRPLLGHGSLACTDDGPLMLVVQPRTRNNFDEQRWLNVATWMLQAPEASPVPGPAVPVFEHWELWACYPGTLHAGQAELVARGPGGPPAPPDSRH